MGRELRPVEEVYRLVGYKIRCARVRLGMTQTTLAAAIGQTRLSLVSIEAGRQRVQLHDLMLIAAVLGVDQRELLP